MVPLVMVQHKELVLAGKYVILMASATIGLGKVFVYIFKSFQDEQIDVHRIYLHHNVEINASLF